MTVPPLHSAERCPRCRLKVSLCLCAEIPRVETRTRIVVVRHIKELWKASDTARLAAFALPRCAILDFGARGGAPLEPELEKAGSVLLYPDATVGAETAPSPERVVVLDGSWPQTRHMISRLPALQRMPRLTLPVPVATPARLRTGRHPHEMATLEAIAHALARLEGEAVARPLHELYALFLARSAVGRRGH